ncbi:Gfo/Idh/MocA family protein [Candidatus Clostridium radicumherbarum]|uniref:Gfo/Idh/MocA family protein n=1 Tax=Candidatus Clostridium radicumherbarum TaxID=3381662 RepID=A0ABW8TXI9_9CLOT
MKRLKLRYGMVGGDLSAFIGGVHRRAIAIEERAVLTAGCFSSHKNKNQECADFYNLENDRVYKDFKEMAEKESLREDKIDFVSIVTPNETHYEVAKTFLEHGIHVVCEKPLCLTREQALELEKLAKEKSLFFAVTYTYSGYAMVKQARKLVKDGYIGKVVNINAEYLQEWLIDEIGSGNESTKKLSVWRMDPKLSGISNCVGDIGTHIENTVAYVTGLKPVKVAAVLDTYGQVLDMNANMLVEFDNGAHGVFSCSQVCIGHANGLVIRVFGTEGAIEWKQEDPNYLFVTKKGQPMQIFNRGMGYINGRAALINRIPSGHPEGLMIAFANIYQAVIQAILKKENDEMISEGDLDFPNVSDGREGVNFIHAVVESNNKNSKWVEL